MSYIQNNLQAGEEIKYKADIHWYIFAYPVILLLLSAFFSSAQTGLFYYVSILLLLSGLFQLSPGQGASAMVMMEPSMNDSISYVSCAGT